MKFGGEGNDEESKHNEDLQLDQAIMNVLFVLQMTGFLWVG